MNTTIPNSAKQPRPGAISDIVVAPQGDDPEEPIPFHRHCQKTVCSAYGDDGQGETRNIIEQAQETLINLNGLDIPGGWISLFSRNKNNITQDLESILELIDKVAGKTTPPTYTLTFQDSNGQQIASDSLSENTVFRGFGRDVELKIDNLALKFNTMNPTVEETTQISLPRHSLTIQQDGESDVVVPDIAMGSDATIDIKTPFDRIYPVGTVYSTTSWEFSPSESFGGTWQDITPESSSIRQWERIG